MREIFFSAGYYFPRYILASSPASKSVYRIFFFWNHPYNLHKVKLLASKIHQTLAQWIDSDMSIISKAF